ncbi:MAG: flippase-like domain-containing protein [Bacteroidales bacterium]|nr:flippase-like domain-containing protein [Bacteroidales bacterium]
MKWINKRTLRLALSIALSVLILFLIYDKIDFASMQKVFSEIRVIPLIIFLLLFIPQLWLATKRWNIMTKEIGKVKLGLFTSFKQVVGSYSANLIIPGKMGEIVRIPWMKIYKLETPVLMLVFLEKIFDVLAVFFILFVASITYLFFSAEHQTLLQIVVITLSCGFLFLFLFYFNRKRISLYIDRRFADYLSTKKEDFIYFKIKNALKYVDSRITWYFLMSILLWIVQVCEFYFIFVMFNIFPHVLDVYVGISLALLAGALPISIAGLGPRDAVIIKFFSTYAPIEILAGVGIISLFRIIVTALIGLPFFMTQTRK